MKKIFLVLLLTTMSRASAQYTGPASLFMSGDSVVSNKEAHGFKGKFFKATGVGGFIGDGSLITGLNATQLTSGTIPDGRFPATLPAVSGANLTNLNASNITAGTVGSPYINGNYTSQTRWLHAGNDFFGDTVSVSYLIGNGAGITGLTQALIAGLTDSIAAKLNRGEATTLFAAKINYSDTTNTLANQWRLGGYYARGDTGAVLASKSFVLNQYYARGDTGAVLLGKTRASEIYQPILFSKTNGTVSLSTTTDTLRMSSQIQFPYSYAANNYGIQFWGDSTRFSFYVTEDSSGQYGSQSNTQLKWGYNIVGDGSDNPYLGTRHRYFHKIEGNWRPISFPLSQQVEEYINAAIPGGGISRFNEMSFNVQTGQFSQVVETGYGTIDPNRRTYFYGTANGLSHKFQIRGIEWLTADSVNGSIWTSMKGDYWIKEGGALIANSGTWRFYDGGAGYHSLPFQFGAASQPSAGSQVVINSTVANALLFKTTGGGTQGSIDSSANASLRSLILTTALDTAYSNSVSDILVTAPLSVATSGKTKFLSLSNLGSMYYVDSTKYHGSESINTLGTITSGGSITLNANSTIKATNLLINTSQTGLPGYAVINTEVRMYTDNTDATFAGGFLPNGGNLYVRSNGALVFGSGFAEKARILTNGNFGINTTTPENKLRVVGGISGDSLYIGQTKIVDMDKNLSNIGTISSAAVTATGLSSFSENGGTATAGVGDSVQVTVTGVAPSTCQAVASYAEVTTAITIPPGAVCWSANTLTIYGANGKKLKYSISVK